jgi:hypothetical protein
MAWYKPWTWGDESESAVKKRDDLNLQGQSSSNFAGASEGRFGELGSQLSGEAQYLRDVARGGQSVSAEQLRQALGQNLSAQRSMAASAAPRDSTMAALMASRNAMQLGSGLAGQQALAGMQERQAAQRALMEALMQQRQQELQAALGGRQTAVGAYGGVTPEGSFIDKWAGPIMGAATIATGGGRQR